MGYEKDYHLGRDYFGISGGKGKQGHIIAAGLRGDKE